MLIIVAATMEEGRYSDDDFECLFLTPSTTVETDASKGSLFVYSDISSDETDKNLQKLQPEIHFSDEELVASCKQVENYCENIVNSRNTKTLQTTVNAAESKMPSRFHPVTSEETINKMGTKRFAASTDSKIRWATNLFREWQSHRNEVAEEEPSKNLSYILVPLENMSVDELNYTISRFVCEVKKIDGTDYPSDTLYGLVICLQLYMDSIGRTYKFLADECFSQIKNTLDNAMKERAKNHVNSAKKQAEVITLEEEEVLWSSSVLGSDTPKQLVETLFYLIGINFALRGGQEHRNLRWGASSQLRLGQDQHGRYLSYTEDVSKTNQGGLKHRKCKVKSVRAYENREIPERCPVQLYERYSNFRPLLKNDSEPFYLRPLDNPRGEVWYSSQGIGRHTLAGIVSDVCKRAGIPGYRTNHSLRASAATRLYDAGVDEQLICEVTGHRSSAVREYKRTNSAQKQKLSTIVQGHSRDLSSPAKKMALENISVTVNVDVNK